MLSDECLGTAGGGLCDCTRPLGQGLLPVFLVLCSVSLSLSPGLIR